ncbi:MAG: Glu-tRNA(Gln) amidotransferase subunit GatD [Candidatus Pacearchaeota archaeon]|nr:Glu-tRNA(Gln) amidotransferase subunit GatD [Candidatus Pacearchaeota archaeon]
MEKEKKSEFNRFVGKKVRVSLEKQEFQGTVLESYDPSLLLLKLKSGYNIGIEKNKIKNIEELKEKKEEIAEIKEIKPRDNLPEVAIIVTGGTISSRVDYKTGAVRPLTKPEDIIATAPRLGEIIKPIIESPFLIFSENITANEWKKLALTIEKALNKQNIKGVIVLAGTDTLHYIASALSFMLGKLNKPVVLTCSQRSIDRGSTDALLNLICAAYASLSDIAEVMIVSHASCNDDFCFALRGTKARKMHTSRRDAFRPINTKPLAKIHSDGKIEKLQDYNKRDEKIIVKAEPFFEDKVALIKWHPNLSPELLDFFIKNNYKGLVIEATGFGHVASGGRFSWLYKLKEAIKKGIVVCFACQTLYGTLDAFVYSAGRDFQKAGILFLKDILPETAFVKLGFLLGKEKNTEKVKMLMLKNIAGEFNQKLSEKDFLI